MEEKEVLEPVVVNTTTSNKNKFHTFKELKEICYTYIFNENDGLTWLHLKT